MIDGNARPANREELKAYREALAEAKRVAERAEAAARLQVTVLSTTELDKLRSEARGHKE